MFKFMKSKKGFTLVELMIVVVIMAILVAVAVPIFSAVTKNAQRKTCDANRREIVAQVSNYCMGGGDDGTLVTTAGEFQIKSDGKKGAVVDGKELAPYTDDIDEMFQEIPACPVKDAVYTVKVEATNAGSSPTIKVGCSVEGHLDADGNEITTKAQNKE